MGKHKGKGTLMLTTPHTAPSKITKTIMAGLFAFSILGAAPAVTMPVEQAQAAPAKVYIATQSGTKYHKYRSCRTLKRSKSVKKVTLKKAKSMGYRSACKVCCR